MYDLREVGSIDVVKGTVDVFLPGGSVATTVPITKCFARNPKHMSDLCGLHNIHEAGEHSLRSPADSPNWKPLRLQSRPVPLEGRGYIRE